MAKLEICVDSMVSVIAAQRGGADRIELCANLQIGGTTPAFKLMRQARAAFEGQIHVMIRPRFGDFCYDRWERDEMLDAVRISRVAGADGVVAGMLTREGRVDKESMEKLRETAGKLKVTFHRAIDMVSDIDEALEICKSIGIDYILTSGGKKSAPEGIDTISRLVRQSENRIAVMPGAGITRYNVADILTATGAQNVHMSAKTKSESPMIYRNTEISMGVGGFNEYERVYADEEEIRYVKSIIDAL